MDKKVGERRAASGRDDIASLPERDDLEQISVRLPRSDLDALRERARNSGIGYTTLLRMIVHEHVNSPLTR